MSGRVRRYPSIWAFLGFKWGQVAILGFLTTLGVGFEALVLDAVSRLLSLPSGADSGSSDGGGISVLAEAWSQSLSQTRLLGRLLDPANLYLNPGQQAALWIFAAITLLSLTRFIQIRHRGWLVSRFAYRVREHLITRFFRLKYSVFRQLSGRQVAHLASTEGNQAVQGVTHLLSMISLGFAGASYLLVALLINPYSTVIALILGGGVIHFLKVVSRRLRAISALQVDLISRFNRRMVEVNSVYKHARMTGARSEASSELSGLAGRIAATFKLRFDQSSKVVALQQPMMMLVLIGVLVLSLGSGWVTMAQTILALGLIYRGVNSLMSSITEYNGYLNSRSSISGLRSFIEYLASSDDENADDEQTDDALSSARGSVHDPVGRIQVINVSYAVNRTSILEGVSFEAERGEVVGIFGHSGSGKSTLLEVMMGLLEPSWGQIRINDSLISDFVASAGRRSFGYVGSEMLASETAVISQLSHRLKWPEAITEFRRVLQDLGCGDWSSSLLSKVLEGAESERHGQLSMGQKQVLTLVKELMRDPTVLVLDEITAHMDPLLMRRVFSHLKQVTADRITFIVSHDLELLEYCSKVVVLNQGRMVATGAPEQIRRVLDDLETFSRSPESGPVPIRHIVSDADGVRLQISRGDHWIECRVEEISMDGIGFVWPESFDHSIEQIPGTQVVLRIETDHKKIIVNGIIEHANEIGGRLNFTDLDENTIDFMSELLRTLGISSDYGRVA